MSSYPAAGRLRAAQPLAEAERRRCIRSKFRHAAARADERYGLDYTRDLALLAAAQITERRSLTVKRYDDGGVYIVSLRGRAYPVFFDGQLRMITTFLPPTDARLKPYNLVLGRTHAEPCELFGVHQPKPQPDPEPAAEPEPLTFWKRLKAAWLIVTERR